MVWILTTLALAAPEFCDGIDNDGDGQIDEGPHLIYADNDGDGAGDPRSASRSEIACVADLAPPTDCDDSNPLIKPGIAEDCDGVDQDCDGVIDNGAACTNCAVTHDGGSTYQTCTGALGFDASGAACASDGYSLAVINTLNEENHLWTQNVQANGHWFDLQSPNDGDTSWYIAGGGLAPFLHWAPNEPTMSFTPVCGQLWQGQPGGMIDFDCDNAIGRYCEAVCPALTWYADNDLDGQGGPNAVSACVATGNLVAIGGDCADGDPDRYASAAEICNGLDDDCDGLIDEGAGTPWYEDIDLDGFGATSSLQVACSAPPGFIAQGGDCVDTDIDIHPAASDVCDDVDNDCDGVIDEDPNVIWFSDGDGDNFGTGLPNTLACDAPVGFVGNQDDCDDTNDQIHPGAAEVCDAVDNNCNTQIDEAGGPTWYEDADGDGFGGTNTLNDCTMPGGYVSTTGDCVDSDASIFPGAPEVCNDLDDDCDLQLDEGLVTSAWFFDGDDDGYGATGSTPIQDCNQPPDHVDNALDCVDDNGSIYPGVLEVCDGVDNNCNGGVDEGVLLSWWADDDNDAYGDPNGIQLACSQPPGAAPNADDCDDDRAEAYPGAPEQCNELDDDCDTMVDEGVTPETWYADADGDGFGDLSDSIARCEAPPGHVGDSTDCNDGVNTIFPGAVEFCNLLDDNCDGQVDEGGPEESTWWLDADLDGFGGNAESRESCDQPLGFVLSTGDCDDTDDEIHPGAIEVCDLGVDNDCDALVDDDDPSVAPTSPFYRDADSDGFGDGQGVLTCLAPAGRVSLNGDCDDEEASINPNAEEVCDNVDNNCDTLIDDADPNVQGFPHYEDLDGDGTGGALIGEFCIQPGAGSAFGGDCDDTDPSVYINAPEPCDGVDHNCDGASIALYSDDDGDGFGGEVSAACDPSVDLGTSGDCDDTNAAIYPGANEVLDDGIDQDCDGSDATSVVDTDDTDVPVDTDDTDVVIDTDPEDTADTGSAEATAGAASGCRCESGATEAWNPWYLLVLRR